MINVYTEGVDVRRQQRFGADYAQLRHSQRRQRVDLRACHTRVQHIADDRHAQLGEVLLVVADGEHVEQTLRRVRVAPVAGVDDVDVLADVACDQVWRSALAVAHDEHVGLHCRQIGHRVEHRLALGLRRNVDGKIDDIGRQPLGCDFECRARASRRLEEKVENCLAAQQRHFFYLALCDADERFRGIEDLREYLRRQSLDR